MKHFLYSGLLTILLVTLLVAVLPVGIVKLCARTVESGEADSAQKKQKYAYQVSVYLTGTGKVIQADLEEYVKCVTASEMPAAFELEALKAQAVAARTYAVAKQEVFQATGVANSLHPQAPLCDDVHCQVYRDMEAIEQLKSSSWMQNYWGRIEGAVEETMADVMVYQGRLVEQPLFYSSSGGRTENSEDVFSASVPYLRSVASLYEEEAPHQNERKEMGLKELRAAVKQAKYGDTGTLKESNIEILSRNEGGSVEKIKLGKLTLKGRDVRVACALRSSEFEVEVKGSKVIFTTKGYGHGVGMSQWGAEGMAKNHYTYEQILKHYYSGVEIKTLGDVMLTR